MLRCTFSEVVQPAFSERVQPLQGGNEVPSDIQKITKTQQFAHLNNAFSWFRNKIKKLSSENLPLGGNKMMG